MISAHTFVKAQSEISKAEAIVKVEAPMAQFVLVGVDSTHIYFNVVAKLSHITSEQIRNLKEKTRFEAIEESAAMIYKGSFQVAID